MIGLIRYVSDRNSLPSRAADIKPNNNGTWDVWFERKCWTGMPGWPRSSEMVGHGHAVVKTLPKAQAVARTWISSGFRPWDREATA